MTTLDFSMQRIADRAVAIKPTRVLMWLVAAPFLLLGLVLRLLWLIPALLIGAFGDGWAVGDKLVRQMQSQARESAARGG